MTLYQSVKGNGSNLAIKIRKVLKERQSSCNADQKKFFCKRIKEKQLKSEKSKDYFKNLLHTFRSWRFPWRTSGFTFCSSSKSLYTRAIVKTGTK